MKRRLVIALAALALLGAVPSPAWAHDEPDFGAESILILAPYFPKGYWWDHTTLTVRLKAAGNVDEAQVAAVREAIAIWNAAIAHRHGAGFVQMVEVTGDPAAAAKADLTVNLHAQGGALFGVANCRSGKHCQVLAWDHDRASDRSWNSYPLAYEEMISLIVHELGHALGLGHTTPLFGTMDVMGYGTETVLFPAPVISRCDMDAFDVVWAWAINNTPPQPPTATEIACA